MELGDLHKMVYYDDDDKLIFTDDEGISGMVYCVAVWWHADDKCWYCGYVHRDDADARPLFLGSGKHPQTAIAQTWARIKGDR